MDVYADFIAEASTGKFRAPIDGSWTAEQIVAHVARTHEELIEVTEALLSGNDVSYDSRQPINAAELTRYIRGYGGLRGLADRVAVTVTVLRDLSVRLAERGAPLVPVRDCDGSGLDQPLPWDKVLELDETVHAPRYLGQLRALRTE
jgi:hypothetical protein